MSKRFKMLLYIVLPIILLLILSPTVITFFFFPRYRLIGEGVMFLLVAVVQFFAGFKQMQVAKRMEKPILWWKSYSIIFGLMWSCFGGLFLLISLTQTNHQIDKVFGSSIGTLFGILFVLFIVTLCIYGIILVFQQTTTNKRYKKPL